MAINGMKQEEIKQINDLFLDIRGQVDSLTAEVASLTDRLAKLETDVDDQKVSHRVGKPVAGVK
tara:strand:- start:238 stop:429 length:192 start_codon:yes stop_codon:yes gene_type:complete